MMIGIINAGDWYELNTIELVASVIRVTDVDIVHGKLQYWHKEQQSEQVSGNHNFLDKDMTVNHMTVFIRRELLKKIGVFSTKFQYAMDYELLLRAVNYGASFFYIDMVLSNMRTEGKSHIGWRRALREVAYAKRLHSSAVLSPWVYYCYQLVNAVELSWLPISRVKLFISLFENSFITSTRPDCIDTSENKRL